MYQPYKSTKDKIPLIKKKYYDEKLSITRIAKELKMDSKTVRNVLVYCLHGTLPRSDIAKNSFHRLTQEQKENFTKSASQHRVIDEEYIQKLSNTKLGTKNPVAKLNENHVREIRKLYAELLTKGHKKTEAQFILADKFSVKRPTISDIVLKRTWKHIE